MNKHAGVGVFRERRILKRRLGHVSDMLELMLINTSGITQELS